MHQNTQVQDLSRDTMPLRGRKGLPAFIRTLPRASVTAEKSVRGGYILYSRSRVYEMSRKCVAAAVAVSSLLKLRGPDHQRELRKDRLATQPKF